jgi:hypothetical protein
MLMKLTLLIIVHAAAAICIWRLLHGCIPPRRPTWELSAEALGGDARFEWTALTPLTGEAAVAGGLRARAPSTAPDLAQQITTFRPLNLPTL